MQFYIIAVHHADKNHIVINKAKLMTLCIVFPGTVALCSLLTGSVISRFYTPEMAATILGQNETDRLLVNVTAPEGEPIEVELPDSAKIMIAMSVCFLVGVVQVRPYGLTMSSS